ncbi:MAG: hypothetical protein ACOYW7_00845 [Nitrospirota bacterium]
MMPTRYPRSVTGMPLYAPESICRAISLAESFCSAELTASS